MTKTPFRIEVIRIGRLTGTWANHRVIEASAPLDLHATMAANTNVQRWAAGVLTRLLDAVTDDVAKQVDQCGCPNVCRAFISNAIVSRETFDDWDIPSLTIWTKRDDETAWLKLVQRHITAINKADRWQPSAEDERAWTSGQPEHLAVPPFDPTKATAR